MPLLSVVVPNYNHGKFLRQQLEALSSQSVQPLEIIFIDDCSTDDSMEIAKDCAQRHPFIRILRNKKNIGVLRSLERGAKEARGDFLFFAAADDLVLPGLLEKSLEQLEKHPQAAFCSSLVKLLDQDSNDISQDDFAEIHEISNFIPAEKAAKTLEKYDTWFQGSTTIYRRSHFEKIGGFDPKLESFTDAFLCMVLVFEYGACFIPEPLAYFRKDSGSFSGSVNADLERLNRIFNYAKYLMTERYNYLFPMETVSLWERRWRYTVASNLVNSGESDYRILKNMLLDPMPFDGPIIKILMATGPFQKRLINAYLLASLLPKDFIHSLKRKLMRTVNKLVGPNS